ncbi:uncharacterized protein LOC128990184 [Macrosteles quadrilineatus]|uniref:uncharacterized protein LOC128990184 n=1 Tax=Macrosteles quadrilineatus TaxID=74068 RepID=UPI0023E21BDD|nr:uncharacterized protein LOC128990184 [Macrosteles quadrilineatus]
MKPWALGFIVLVAGVLEIIADGESVYQNSSTLEEPEPIRLLYGESHGIAWTDVTTRKRQRNILTKRYLDVDSIDYHYKRNLFYYTGWGAIWRLPMEDAGPEAQGEEIVRFDYGVGTLAVDWEHERIYWTSPSTGFVWRLGLDENEGNSVVVVENAGNLTRHNNVAVDPYMRYLFVATESGHSLRTDLDGDNRMRLNHGLRLTSLALDLQNRRVYTCGSKAFAPVLQSSDYWGENVMDYEIQHGSDWWIRLIGLDVFSTGPDQPPQLFWVHQGWSDKDTAWRVNTTNGHLSWEQEYVASGTVLDPETRIWCVKVYHSDVQRRPKYLDFEEDPVPSSSEAMAIANWTVIKSDGSSYILTSQSWLGFLYLGIAVAILLRPM